MKPLRIAHRGDWRRGRENSVAAFRAALAIPGCDGIEFDVRLSTDGVPVLNHDETLARVQGVPRAVANATSVELADLGVAELAEVLAIAGREPFLDIELKVLPDDAVIRAIAAARGHRREGLHRAVISSFDADALATVAAVRPSWKRWLNTWVIDEATLDRAVALECSAIAANWRAINTLTAAQVRSAGLGLAAWTVRRRSTYLRLERLGVIAIVVEAGALDR